jgi:hypothetical protein
MEFIEIIGYAGSVLVAISLMMSAIVKLRIINLIGSLTFSVYGFIIGALPVGLLNGFIVLVNLYYLYEIFNTKEFFKVLEIRHNDEYLKYFLDFHIEDIKKFNPGFEFDPKGTWKNQFILRNSLPAGLVCMEQLDEHSLYIKLDYVIPGYRDFKAGKYVFKNLFSEEGITKIYADSGNDVHTQYLKKMGFVANTSGSGAGFVLEAMK